MGLEKKIIMLYDLLLNLNQKHSVFYNVFLPIFFSKTTYYRVILVNLVNESSTEYT